MNKNIGICYLIDKIYSKLKAENINFDIYNKKTFVKIATEVITTNKISKEKLIDMVSSYLYTMVLTKERSLIREKEEKSIEPIIQNNLNILEKIKKDNEDKEKESLKKDVIESIIRPCGSKTYNELWIKYPEKVPLIVNVATVKAFRKRLEKLGYEFEEWYQKAEAGAVTRGATIENFFFYWKPVEYNEQEKRRYIQSWGSMINELVQDKVLKLTEELLSSKFSLYNGKVVTWGEATKEEHKLRYQELEKNGVGIMETASRHKIAITMLENNNVTCLSELTTELVD